MWGWPVTGSFICGKVSSLAYFVYPKRFSVSQNVSFTVHYSSFVFVNFTSTPLRKIWWSLYLGKFVMFMVTSIWMMHKVSQKMLDWEVLVGNKMFCWTLSGPDSWDETFGRFSLEWFTDLSVCLSVCQVWIEISCVSH